MSDRTQFLQKNPKPIMFYKTEADYLKALKNPPKNGTPYGVRIATKETTWPGAKGCIAFLQQGKTAHNGVFMTYIAPNGKVYTGVTTALDGVKKNPGGTLTYAHWNLQALGGGRYRLFKEPAVKANVTNLRLLP